jgi:hypothetical protein
MPSTEETTATGGDGQGAPPPAGRSGWQAAARRYGPIALVAALVGAAVLVFGRGGGDDDDGDGQAAGGAASSEEELILSGPMTPQKAELEGETDVDFGPHCDPETGKLRLPTIYAAPCVVPFDGDNGGATSPGVTADTVKIIGYLSDPAIDPVGASLIAGAGANISPDAAAETMRDYADVFNSEFETYGRRVELHFYSGTGAADDETAARADAIAIADQEPFAVLGGPLQVQAPFSEELAARGVISFPSQPLPQSVTVENYPMIWGVITPTQAATLAAEAIGKLAGPGRAELAGDPELREQERAYAVVHYDTADGGHQESFDALRDGLADQGVDLATDIGFILDANRAQEAARTMVTQLKEARVTTVIFTGDFLMPQFLTTEATAQDYSPEWILGPSFLADTAFWGRTFDQQQWGNGFAIGYAGTPGETEDGTSYTIYTWAYGEDPPSNIYTVLEPSVREVFTGIQLAGPELTPETFRDGLLRFPPTGGGPTRPLISRGDRGIWPEFDYGGAPDQITLMWWDPEAETVDEVGNPGVGSYRFANRGERYRPGELRDSIEDAGLFDEASSIIEYDELPEEDRPPEYEPPDLVGAGGE